MNNKLRSKSMDMLFHAILALSNTEECYAFFDDICTIHELQALSQRMDVAIMLTEGKTYIEIGEKTGASTATISRVNRSLQYGSDGYKTVIERLQGREDQSSESTAKA